MNEIALLSILFDYPEYHQPLFLNNALKYFKKDQIFVARFNNLVQGSYYDKLYQYKIVHLYNYIKENLLNYKYILFGDAKDTNFYKDPSNIINDFNSYNCNIVFCAEINLWPAIDQSHLYDSKPKNSAYRYLNSGLYFGYTEHILKHLENIIKEDRQPYDDQAQWAIEYLISDDIKLDQDRKMFFSTLEAKSDVIVEGNKYTISTNPYMVHDNGPYNDNTIKISYNI